ncbi:hypothetical protein EV178_002480 [Coemansia sp. RSA 1646]|nr:hypothetical protein EV178_002480 [Coemansia sp. RSA 1646]
MGKQEQRERELDMRASEFKEHPRQLEQTRCQKRELQQQHQPQQQQNQTRRQTRRTAAPSVPSTDNAQPGRRHPRHKASPGADVVQPSGSARHRVVATVSSDPEVQPRSRSKRKAATASMSAATAPEQEQTVRGKRADLQ